MLKFASQFLLAASLICLISCKKEKTIWDTDWSAPIAYGHLTMADFVPEENLMTNDEGYLSLIIRESVLEFSLDTLIKMPDTTITTKTAIGIPSIEVSPSFSMPDNYDQEFELGDIELKNVIIESGYADAKISSPWPGKTKVVAKFPFITRDGEILQRTYYLDAGSVDSPSKAEDLIDMVYQSMDLRGIDESAFNTLAIEILVQSNEESETFTITQYDSISFSFQFKDLVPNYARGYFGQYHFSDTTGFSLAPLKKIMAGSVELDSIKLNIAIKNGFNLLAQAKISKLSGINTRTNSFSEFDFTEKNTVLNINPASGGYYDFEPSNYPININNSNSNILSFLENLSDSLIIGYELDINPFGNITGGNDEFFPGSKMELYLDGEFPLNFGANDLTIQDTFEVNGFTNTTIDPQTAYATLNYTNGFPLEADASLFILDEDQVVIDTIYATPPLQAGIFNEATSVTTPKEGSVNFNITSNNMSNLVKANKIILNVSFNSYNNEKIKISAASYLDFNLKSNLNLRIQL